MAILLLALGAGLLSFANGANDNFKGVATLYGSGTTNFRGALAWATVATFSGSLLSVALAADLARRFSGKGLVADAVAGSPDFLLAVGLGAAVTVLGAALVGYPISTTHALVGGLVGAGSAAAGSELNLARLGSVFVLPLIVSPIVAAVGAAGVYRLLSTVRKATGVTSETTVLDAPAAETRLAFSVAPPGRLNTGRVVTYIGSVAGVRAQAVLDALHFASAGVVSFARGLNDTPKIVGLLLVADGLGIRGATAIVAVTMAAGGLLGARRVAETMSHRITALNPGQGFTANVVTGLLVTVASRYGLPVSTTHVSVGSLFGIGASTGEGNGPVMRRVVNSWILTLPAAALLSAVVYLVIA